MRIVIGAVGKLKDKAIRSIADDYLHRIRRFVRCDEVEARDISGLERALPADGRLVALEVDGETIDSRQLARRIEDWGSTGKGTVSFLVGGAEGIPKAVSQRAHSRLSLSQLTLPHRLARIVLLEQVYRAFTIIRGTPYARE